MLNRYPAHDWLTGAQEDDNPTLHMVAAFLLFDGRANENDATFENMMEEGAFPRLVSLIQSPSVREDARLHQMLMELMYESSRIQRLKWEDFMSIDDSFILYLLEIIEGASDDAQDPYHYPIIRVLVCSGDLTTMTLLRKRSWF